MLDIETLGQDPGCVVLSIGAVAFDEDVLSEKFHERISIESCTDAGLEVDGNTLEWWLDQDEDAKEALKGSRPLQTVLEEFSIFYIENCDGNIWANAPSFDCEILKAAYEAVGEKPPWEYYEQRCYRTMKNVAGVSTVTGGTKHDALDDAINQAATLQKALNSI